MVRNSSSNTQIKQKVCVVSTLMLMPYLHRILLSILFLPQRQQMRRE
jgi:hypothetical protein